MVRTSVHQFFKGERRLPPMRTETATTGDRQVMNVRHYRAIHVASVSCKVLARSRRGGCGLRCLLFGRRGKNMPGNRHEAYGRDPVVVAYYLVLLSCKYPLSTQPSRRSQAPSQGVIEVTLVRGKRKAEGGSRSVGRRESERDPWPGGADRKYCRRVDNAIRLLWPALVACARCALPRPR